jgi:hypothetical protein
MEKEELNFLEYLGREDEHLHKNLRNLKGEFNLFYAIDYLYKKPLQRLNADDRETVLARLFHFVHSQLYFSLNCLFRSHWVEFLATIKKAVEASLKAYKILMDQDSSPNEPDENRFQDIFQEMRVEILRNRSRYPLAPDLVKIYENFSHFNLNVDLDLLMDQSKPYEFGSTFRENFSPPYRRFSKEEIRYKFYYVQTLYAFLLMYLIFSIYLDQKLKVLDDPSGETPIHELRPKLEALITRYSRITQEKQ